MLLLIIDEIAFETQFQMFLPPNRNPLYWTRFIWMCLCVFVFHPQTWLYRPNKIMFSDIFLTAIYACE